MFTTCAWPPLTRTAWMVLTCTTAGTALHSHRPLQSPILRPLLTRLLRRRIQLVRLLRALVRSNKLSTGAPKRRSSGRCVRPLERRINQSKYFYIIDPATLSMPICLLVSRLVYWRDPAISLAPTALQWSPHKLLVTIVPVRIAYSRVRSRELLSTTIAL